MPKSAEPLWPLIEILREQIVPQVQQHGMKNVIVGAPSWRQFQSHGGDLPEDVFITRQTLKSKRTTLKSRASNTASSCINAIWPEDGLCSTTMPVLMFVVGGRVALPLGDYVVHCRSGHVVLMPAGTPHPSGALLCTESSHAESEFNDMFSIIPWGRGVACWLNHTKDGEHWSHRTPGENCQLFSTKANFYLEAFAEEAITRAPYFQRHCDGLLLALMTLLLREIEEQRAFQPILLTETAINPTAPPHLLGQNPITRAQAYINAYLSNPLTIDQVATHVFMSRANFTRQFRKATGKTFIQYVTERRLEEAKVLLQDTNWPIEKISEFVGITPTRLRNIFLEYQHQTPSAYREQIRQQSGIK